MFFAWSLYYLGKYFSSSLLHASHSISSPPGSRMANCGMNYFLESNVELKDNVSCNLCIWKTTVALQNPNKLEYFLSPKQIIESQIRQVW